MSVKDLKEYGKRAATDPAVRARAKSIGLQNVKAQADYAKTLGFHFDQSDMAELAKEVVPKGELSEKELAKIAGGVVSTTAALAVTAATAVTSVAVVTTASGGW